MSEKRWLCLALIVVGILISHPVAGGCMPMNIAGLTRRYRVTVLTPSNAGARTLMNIARANDPTLPRYGTDTLRHGALAVEHVSCHDRTVFW